jgi:enoyl-CoA hydratase/carnithine racemase
MGDFVRLEVSEGVGTIRLDRPPMNAINDELTRELGEAATDASLRDDVRAVVIWGGDKIFAAGADVKMMLPMSPLEVKPMITALQEVFNQVEEIPKVTVAAINGFCLGGGCELAMCADFRVAAEDAKLGQPEILLGIIPGAGGTQRMPRLIGLGRAKDLIYSGRMVRADEARQIGLVHEVFPAGEVYPHAVEMAQRYAKGPVAALRAAKVALNWGARGDVRSGIVLEREVFADLFSTEDQKTGMQSLLDKGPGKASFSGR